jgi:hypothetical protein
VAVVWALKEQLMAIQRWWRRCAARHARRFARLRLLWVRAETALMRRALMFEVSRRRMMLFSALSCVSLSRTVLHNEHANTWYAHR